ncbi:7-cyano-7-deazaguanine synthase [bacterium]|nr:7-cyano-7-deazaguanine synthase [bacterium]
MKNSALILLSGGLDSLVALDIVSKEMNIALALTFNYGQKAFLEEEKAAKEIAKIYNIKHLAIELPFLQKITINALTDDNNCDFDNLKSVWIPNRNGLFLNIAACYCEQYKIDYIVFGANSEEGRDFSDNRQEFGELCNKVFEYSTMTHPKVLAPCVEMSKVDMVNYMIENNISFKLIKSCYRNEKEFNKKHCNKCMSCRLLYNAIKNSTKPELLNEVF